MLVMAPDRLMAVLEELDPEARALLDLTVRRGLRDEELAELLKTEPTEVARQRSAVLEQVAAEVGSSRPEQLPEVRTALAELPPEGWGLRPETPQAPPPPGVAPDRVRVSPRRILYALLPLLAVALIVAALLAAGAYHGGDEDTGPAPAPAPPQAQAGGLGLTPLMGSAARGSARISGGRLELTASGLRPRARYQVWLYSSIADAVPVASLRGPSGRVDARLPAGAARHRFLDVSLEPADGNRNHSGQSVLRVPLSKLR
jgi:hypothetical protein